MVEERDFLTVAEVMAHLQMGRTFVYQEARRYLRSGGAEGIPCRKFGRMLRFPVGELRAYAASTAPKPPPPPPSRPTSRRSTRVEQSSLFEA